ncbi:hypothetical protein HLBENOHH_02478 [Aeromonas dhakensis]|uniref:hypothetical protein n=1 Tax=Aeromonas dhakensis TaxID=196024 RepID=UPI00366EC99B
MSIKRPRRDLQIYRGDTPTFGFQLMDVNESTGTKTPIDLSAGFTLKGQVRYSAENTDVLYELPIKVLDAKNGLCQIRIPKTASESLLPPGSSLSDTAVYDIQVSYGDNVLTLLTGGFSIQRDVTRG